MKKIIFKALGLVPQKGTPIDLSYGGGIRATASAGPVERMEYNEYWRWVWAQVGKK
jgi:hypothetical protein